jgi:phosphoethanolamine N-methyltransferase
MVVKSTSSLPLPLAEHRELAFNLSSVLNPGSSVLVVGADFECLERSLKERSLMVACFQHTNSLVPSFSTQRLSNRFDAILFNKAVTNLSDDEVQQLLGLTLAALKPDGYLLLREDLADGTHNIAYYTGILDLYRSPPEETTPGKTNGCDFHWAKCMQSTISAKSRWDDVCWLVQRKVFDVRASQNDTVRAFLDSKQYSDDGIYAYEWIFGEGFISPGGAVQNRKFLECIGLKPGQLALDVGCGIGGSPQMMAEEFGVSVIGVDLSSNMMSVALARANERKNSYINYMVTDIFRCKFEPDTFDVIYSRDCIIHIAEKKALFAQFFKWLKPGGKVVMTDYCVREGEQSAEFKAYVQKRGYTLKPIKNYVEAFKSVGFESVEGIDHSNDFLEILNAELGSAEENKAEFVKRFSPDKYDSLVSGWRSKIGHNKAGDHKWALFKAVKPLGATTSRLRGPNYEV